MVSRESKTSSPGSENGTSGRGAKAARRPRTKPPLDETALRDLALAYVARFATTAARLEGYLARKIRERGVAQDGDGDGDDEGGGRLRELDVAALVARLIELGYIDDEAYARSRSRDLMQRGYGKRRVEQALWAAGVEEQARSNTAPGEAAGRRAALLLARKRGFGPFARDLRDSREDREAAHKRREKQIAAMLRAGHLYEHVQFILDAAEPGVLEEWVSEAEDQEDRRDDW